MRIRVKNQPKITLGRNPAVEVFEGAGAPGLVPNPVTEDGRFLRDDGTWTNPAGSGDVVGPASSVNNRIAVFNGTTGKLIKDGGQTIAGVIAAAPVQSVSGKTGVVTLDKTDVGLGNVDNTSDLNKPISTATQDALDLKYDASNPLNYVDAAGASVAAPVQSVNGQTGVVVLTASDVGAPSGSGTSTGTNTGDQTITLTGDVTGSGTATFATTITNDAVTFAKIQNIGSGQIIGRHSSGSGDPETIGIDGGLEFQGANIRRSALTGDVTASAGSNATTIASGAVTKAKTDAGVQASLDKADTALQPSTAATGTVIDFAVSKVFGSPASPETGNITDDLTGARTGIVQKIYHNAGSEPTVPAGWVLLGSGTYTTSVLNIIYAEWVSGTRVEYWIVQEA